MLQFEAVTTVNKNEMWDGAARSTDDFAGVFEFDEDVGYFYLYDVARKSGEKITSAIHIVSGRPDFAQKDVSIRWTPDEIEVGLFIRGQLWAVFDCETGNKYGGNYRDGTSPMIPSEISQRFEDA